MLNKIRYKIVFNRSGRLNQRGEGLLQIECLQDNRRIYFSTHTYVRPENYSCGRIIGLDNADSLNYALFMMIRDIENIELEYIKKGVDLSIIQKILGHSKIQTTEIYREVDKSTILNGLKKAIK